MLPERPGGDPTDLRLLRHRDGAAGLLVAAVALAAGLGVFAPWYDVEATVTLLGRTETTTVARLAGWAAHAWAVVAGGALVAAAGAAALLAVDRPPPRARVLLLAAAVVASAAGTIALVDAPSVERFALRGSRIDQLATLRAGLPEGVAVDLAVRPTAAVWLLFVAAVVLALAASTHPGLRQ